MIFLKSLVTILALLELSSFSFANEVIGCGGFIKSNTDINYKIIKVKLLTKEKIVKYTTEASPVNGYFMIPVYTKGEYILQVNPPPGWSFEPTEIPINVDGETDACSKNEDINFFFKGFGLSGKVVTQGDVRMNGPSGIQLNLISNKKVIDSTISGSDGAYYFSNVMPGAYQIQAEHKSFKFLTSGVNVVLSKENWSAKENIIVSGFTVEGHVQTTAGTPVPNTRVQLHFSDKASDKFVKTDSDGKFTFSNVAYGKYKLSAALEMENSLFQFSMKPESLNVDLTGHQDMTMTESFQIDKVTITSQALLKKDGKPVETGEVYVNGQKSKETIDKSGKFKLTLTPGNYKIQVKSDKAYFAEKSLNLDLSKYSSFEPSSSQYKELQALNSFVATGFKVCGQVSLIKDQNIQNVYKSIRINAFHAQDMKLLKSVSVDQKLEYCMQLNTNTNYVLKAELTDGKLAKVLKLVPLEKKVSVVDRPVMNINFGQLEAKLEAQLTLLPNANQPTPSDLVVTIKSEDEPWSKDITVKCDKLTCKFSLTNLLFGDYSLTTNYDDLFCWVQDQRKISINSENQMYQLNQAGFKLNYQLSHKNAVLKVDTQVKNIQTNSDLSGVFCLPKVQDYQFVVESCHKYTDVDVDVDHVKIGQAVFKKHANTVSLKATKVQVDFEIMFKNGDALMKDVNVKSEDMSVEAVEQDDKTKTISLKLQSKTPKELVFSGRAWFKPNQKMRFTAKSSKVLFEETLKSLRINEDNCNLNKVKFDAKLGIFITGSIKPKNLENIALTLYSANGKEVLDQRLVKDGFRLGPLKGPHTLYDIELVKSGFLFAKKVSESKSSPDTVEYEFTAEKLGQLKVDVVDKKLGVQLENVLLSLSSDNRQFRQNHKTDSNGETAFENLKPGLYYLIVMMQEYEFTPNSHQIKISDGDHTSIKISAERVAYSCLGKLTSINGQPENGIEIEAAGIYDTSNSDANLCAQSQESAVVENGAYHIYNLKPKCQYTLQLKSIDSDKNTRVVPTHYGFTVGEADVVDRNFILLDSSEKVDVSLGISINKMASPAASFMNYYVKVRVFKMNQPDSVLQTLYAPANAVLYLHQLQRNVKQQYSVHVSLLATSNVYTFASLTQAQQNQLNQLPVVESMEVGFVADSIHKHLDVVFDWSQKGDRYFDQDAYGQEQYQNVYMTLPLFIVIVGILLNSKSVRKQLFLFKDYVNQKGGIVRTVQSTFEPVQLAPIQPKSPRSKQQRYKKQLNTDSSATESDMERSQKFASRQVPTADIENYEIINNEDLDMELPPVARGSTKQRVKRAE